MAAKKTAEEIQESALIGAQGSSPKMEKIMVPVDPMCEDEDSIFIAVNGMNYQIMRGVEVEVPDFIAEAYRHSVKADKEANEKARKTREKMAAKKAV